MVIMES